MGPIVLIILLYIAIGIGLIWFSKRLMKRCPLFFRILFPTAAFAFWFTPGFAYNEGGAMPGPLWLIVMDDTANHHHSLNHPMVVVCFAAVWAAAFGVMAISAGIHRSLLKKDAQEKIPRQSSNLLGQILGLEKGSTNPDPERWDADE